MRSINQNLTPDEQIVFQTKKHWIIFTSPCLLLFMAFCLIASPSIDISFLIHSLHIDFISLLTIPQYLILFILLGFGTVGLLKQTANYLFSSYLVTNTRLLMQEGIINQHTNNARLSNIAHISTNVSLLGNMLNYGSVMITTFGGTNDVFYLVANPYIFQQQVQIQLDKLERKPHA